MMTSANCIERSVRTVSRPVAPAFLDRGHRPTIRCGNWRAGTEFSAVIDRIAPRFARYEPLRHASELMLGMVSCLDRKNCWTIAEHRGDGTPDGLQQTSLNGSDAGMCKISDVLHKFS
jgi:hypothetical protein